MKIRPIIISLLVFAPVLALAGGFSLIWRFFIFLVVVLLVNSLWILFSARGIESKVKRTADSYHVGDFIEEEFTVSYKSRLPSPTIEISENTDFPGRHSTATFTLPRGGQYVWHNLIQCLHRGQYSLGALDVKVTDPLGFISRRCQSGKSREITVYPAVYNLPFFNVVPRIEPGMGPKRRLVSEVGPSASRVRDYFSGDSLRHIHWRTTAHSGQLMVKEFDPDPSNYAFQDVWIVLDINRNSLQGEGGESTDGYMATAAASLVKKYLDSQKRVGLITSGERPHIFLPEVGDRHFQSIMRSLAVAKAGGDVALDTMLNSESAFFDVNSAVIVITTSDSQGIIEPLRRVVSRGSFVITILLDSRSFGGEADAGEAYQYLTSIGISVYIIRQGADIARALDSRTASRPYHSGDVVRKWVAVT